MEKSIIVSTQEGVYEDDHRFLAGELFGSKLPIPPQYHGQLWLATLALYPSFFPLCSRGGHLGLSQLTRDRAGKEP